MSHNIKNKSQLSFESVTLYIYIGLRLIYLKKGIFRINGCNDCVCHKKMAAAVIGLTLFLLYI